MAITYQNRRRRAGPGNDLAVYLDGRHVGTIRMNTREGGFFYQARNGDVGETFATIEEVKASIEGDD